MTQDNDIDTDVSSDESNSDSPVIKALRMQINDLTAKVKDAPDRAAIEAEVRSRLERESAISEQLIALGHPKGMVESVASKLGESEVNRDAVAGALRAIGYDIKDESDGDAGGSDHPAPDVSALANVTQLSREVSSAATGTQVPSVEERIRAAKSPQEVAAIMAGVEGATADYTTL